MNKFWYGISVTFVLCVVGVFSHAEPIDAPKPFVSEQVNFGIIFPGKVINVVDGDTVDVEVRRVIRIRMLDCWAPESRTKDLAEKKEGLEAKAELAKIISGRKVVVQVPIGRDARFGESMTFDRVLGRIIDEETRLDYSKYMVQHGFATKNKEKDD